MSSGRRLDIQGIRAFAVSLVVAFHAGLPVPGGFVGVDIFFALSGYVITAMLMRDYAAHGRVRFGHFYLRRFLRLTPALAVMVGVVALVSLVVQNPYGAQQTTARTGIGALLVSANAVIGHASGDYFAEDTVTNPLLHTWSLSVEEQFYLAFPALIAIGFGLAHRRHNAATLLIVTAVALTSLAFALAWSFDFALLASVTSWFGGAKSIAFYSPLSRAWEFAFGALLALFLPRLAAPSPGTAGVLGAVGGGMLMVAALLIDEEQAFPGFAASLPVGGTMMLILAGTHHTAGFSRLLSCRPLVALGDLSYSWYLWHWPLIVFAALLLPNRPEVRVCAAFAALAPAMASYRFVEQPLRQLSPTSRRHALSVVMATITLPAALCAVLLTGANAGWGLSNTVVRSTNRAADRAAATAARVSARAPHAVVQAGCNNIAFAPNRCRFGPREPDGTVLLAGDSQAWAIADGLIAAGGRRGFDTVVASRNRCPFLGRPSSTTDRAPCVRWQKAVLEWALATRPALVVIANRATGYVQPGKAWVTLERDDGRPARSKEEATMLYRSALEAVVQPLARAGIPVVIVASIPEMKGFTDGTSLLARAVGRQAFAIRRADAVADRQPAFDVEQTLARQTNGITVFDPMDTLCSATSCSTEHDGGPLYQDWTHLSVYGSLSLTDALAGALNSAIDGTAGE